jgi:hypothetical protein
VRNRERAAVITKREKQLKEFIFFKILDDLGNPFVDASGKVLLSSEFKIVRKKVDKAAIVELIRRSPIPDLDIDFFMDDSGNP